MILLNTKSHIIFHNNEQVQKETIKICILVPAN